MTNLHKVGVIPKGILVSKEWFSKTRITTKLGLKDTLVVEREHY